MPTISEGMFYEDKVYWVLHNGCQVSKLYYNYNDAIKFRNNYVSKFNLSPAL